MASIELNGVTKTYGPREVLRDINLQIDEGEFVSIVGTSGTGKSTLLKTAAGLIKPDSGSVKVAGKALVGFAPGAAIVFQNYSLLPWLSTLDNVLLAVDSAFPDWPQTRRRDQAVKYLALVGLGAAIAKRPAQLSGGMRQRVSIARAFAVEPSVLFLDEPFGALDALTRATLQQELARLCDEQQPRATALMITNSVDEAVLLSDRVFALDGAIGNATAGKKVGATLSEAIPIHLPRPRLAAAIARDEEAVRLRANVTESLMAGRKKAGVRSKEPETRIQETAVSRQNAEAMSLS
jgi:nitrate/nitrite transport system ATP-binding protein